jgi:ABC-type multidrug transport system fused ATPase/permease subunit
MFYQKLLFDYIGENVLYVTIYILLLILIFPLEDIIIPRLFGKLYETINNKKTYGDPMNILENMKKMNTPGILSWIISIYIFTLIAENLKFYIDSYISPGYLKYLRSLLFSGTIHKHEQEYEDIKSGEYISKVMEISRNVRDLFQYLISQFLPYVSVGIVLMIYLSYQVPELAPILLIFTMIIILFSLYSSEYIITLVQKREDFFSKVLAESIQDKLHNMMNIVINSEGFNAIKNNDDMETKNKHMMEDIMAAETVSMLSMQLISIISYTICVYTLYNLMRAGKLAVSNMIAYLLTLGKYLSYMQNINWGIVFSISYKFGIVSSHYDFLTDLFKYTNNDNERSDFEDGSIVFENMKFKYKNEGENIFDGLNLEIKNKEKVGIVGRSGSGKTSLTKLIIGLHKYEGSIKVGNQEVSTSNKDDLRQHINYVNQRTQLFNGNIIENMTYGNDASEDDIKDLLNKYNLIRVFSNLEKGLESDVGVNGGKLSLGMQKVVMIVRGILRKSHIIVFDEPLAGLDQTTRQNVINMILEESKNKTLIVITHDKEILPYLDRVINVNDYQ